MNLNKVHLIGRVTRDIELKAMPNGNKVANFSIATNRVYKDKDDKKVEETEFHNIVAFGRTAEVIAQYSGKGAELYIEGRIRTRNYDKDGVKHYRTEIVADSIQLGAKPKGGDGGERGERGRDDEWSGAEEVTGNSSQKKSGGRPGDEVINPDDIPF